MKDIQKLLQTKKKKARPETAIIILILIIAAAIIVGFGWFNFAEAGLIAGTFLVVHLALESHHNHKTPRTLNHE